MKNRYWVTLFFCFGVGYALSQPLLSINEQRVQLQKTGMTVLGVWAIGNMALGSIQMGRTQGETRSFHQMNTAWNLVNLGIAGLGYWQAIRTDPGSLDLWTSMQQSNALQKTLLFNAGLDVGYIASGLYLTERAKSKPQQADRLRGFGKSIMLQGAFLLVFDVANYGLHQAQYKQFQPLINASELTGTSLGLQINF